MQFRSIFCFDRKSFISTAFYSNINNNNNNNNSNMSMLCYNLALCFKLFSFVLSNENVG